MYVCYGKNEYNNVLGRALCRTVFLCV